MPRNLKTYAGASGDVTWDGKLCIHVGECGRAEGDLFQPGRDPWCQPDLATGDDTADVVARCPTGALVYRPLDPKNRETAAPVNTVVVANNGPLYLRGELRIDGAADDMPGVALRAALCRCGQSTNKPFCDNSHEAAQFVDRGAVGVRGTGDTDEAGPLEVKRVPNGPLLLNGHFTIVTASGRTAWRGTKAALCRCGHSKNKPFCDGGHKAGGFVAA